MMRAERVVARHWYLHAASSLSVGCASHALASFFSARRRVRRVSVSLFLWHRALPVFLLTSATHSSLRWLSLPLPCVFSFDGVLPRMFRRHVLMVLRIATVF
ncbi:hypothetical protein TRVL_06398 [Trypanosoma vivax]|nr:hypothetical protein TRVL_06398 [Trypanosoma vivax]